LIGGASAGIAFFLVAYPMDYVKTLLQTDNLEKGKFKGMLDVYKNQYRLGGVSTFYKGLGVALYRSAPVNAGGLFAFEGTLRLLGKDEDSE
jgi:solute carrier family 25 (mitochondrial carnitine/acylcarnitine transporter), member 20/29